MLERAREELSRSNNPEDIKLANALGARIKERGDFSLSPTATLVEPRIDVLRQPLSVETQRFVERLRRNGYAVYDLAGKTPATLRTERMKFWYVNPALENVSASPSLVAFKPKPSEFFLKGSQNIHYEEQLDLLEEEKAKVERAYPDVGLVVRVGKPSEWSEAAYEHFKATNRKVGIFGKDYGYNYTWADAYESDEAGASRAIAGYWGETHGLGVGFHHPDGVDSSLGLASLVEIPRK